MKDINSNPPPSGPQNFMLFRDLVDPTLVHLVPEVGYDEIPELTEEDFKRMRPAREVLRELIGQEATDRLLARSRGMRGPQKAPKKVPISIRLDSDVLDHYRAMGSGWQARMNADLRENLNGLSDAPQSTFTPDPKPSKASPKARTPSKKSRPATRGPARSRKKPK